MPGMPNIPAINAFKNVKFNVIPKIPPIKLKTNSSKSPEILLMISFPAAFIEKLKSPKNSIISTTAIIITKICILSPTNIRFHRWNLHQDFGHYHHYNYYFHHCHHLCCHLCRHLCLLVHHHLYLSCFRYLP